MSEGGDQPKPVANRRGFLRTAAEYTAGTAIVGLATVGVATKAALDKDRADESPSYIDLLPQTPEGVGLRNQLQDLEGVLKAGIQPMNITGVELTPKEAEIVESSPSQNQPADLVQEDKQFKVSTERPRPGDHLSWHFEASRFGVSESSKYGTSYRQEIFAAVPIEQQDGSLKWNLHFTGARTGEIVKDSKTHLKHVTGPFRAADNIKFALPSTPQTLGK